MRITGGKYRGRTIYSGKSQNIRPATDRVRETIFAILPQYIVFEETTVIDLYAGTGSLGFESLSRGAQSVVFVDNSPAAIRFINRTAEALNCTDRCKIILSPIDRFINKTSTRGGLIFADPPYAAMELPMLPGRIARSGIAAIDAILIIEHSKHTAFPDDRSYSVFRQKNFGNTIVSFFKLLRTDKENRENI
jgi:16S rRNA (guanine966-N2)-methyltransferase